MTANKNRTDSPNSNLDSCLRSLYWDPIDVEIGCTTPQVRTMRKENGKVWLRCFPHSAGHRTERKELKAFLANEPTKTAVFMLEQCFFRDVFLRPLPGERRSADMVVVKVIFSPYLRPHHGDVDPKQLQADGVRNM